MATTRLHVAGIAPNITADDLRQLFSGVARVAKVTIPPPRDPQLPRGYAFVEVKNAADADACVAAYDNATWRGGRKLAVARARPDFKRRRELEHDDEEAALAKSADARADRLRRRRVVVRPPPARRAARTSAGSPPPRIDTPDRISVRATRERARRRWGRRKDSLREIP